jgi:hypothetical protein
VRKDVKVPEFPKPLVHQASGTHNILVELASEITPHRCVPSDSQGTGICFFWTKLSESHHNFKNGSQNPISSLQVKFLQKHTGCEMAGHP